MIIISRIKRWIYRNHYHKNDPFIYEAGCWIAIEDNKAYLAMMNVDDELYLLMPRYCPRGEEK